ncbi:MAG: hypothetical protein JWM11_7882 [Planctomycetaceae bacterium]|nr:hypothetical protein [Planctomycetaceae bacterium]
MRRLIAGIDIENDSFVAANSINLKSLTSIIDHAIRAILLTGVAVRSDKRDDRSKCANFSLAKSTIDSKAQVMRRECYWTALILIYIVTSGCTGQPAAPILSNSPVYRNSTEGFRFLVPEGWIQTANSVLPPGKLSGEIFLVRYRVTSPEAGATLQVLCMTDDKSLNMEQHHGEGSFRAGKWNVDQPLQNIEINKIAAERITYKVSVDKREMSKHVTCFHHKGRVYSFVGLFWSDDDQARQQIERAAESVIWEH